MCIEVLQNSQSNHCHLLILRHRLSRRSLYEHDRSLSSSRNCRTQPLCTYSIQRSKGKPLRQQELRKTETYWKTCNYLSLGMIYLQENPLLTEPLRPEHIKNRLLGHWGSSPGLSFIYVHLNRLIKKYDLDMIFLAGPGHGAPGVLGPDISGRNVLGDLSGEESGCRRDCRNSSSSSRFRAESAAIARRKRPDRFMKAENWATFFRTRAARLSTIPNLIVAAVVGDGESETGPLATSWHINKFLNPARDGAVLPILHLNGYKIDNPTILARISHEELENLFRGYGWTPYFVEGSDIDSMHQAMAATTEHCVQEIREHREAARKQGVSERPRWPMIVLRSPKGWTAPREMEGHFLEGFWRAHQVPLPSCEERSQCSSNSRKLDAVANARAVFRQQGQARSVCSESLHPLARGE